MSELLLNNQGQRAIRFIGEDARMNSLAPAIAWVLAILSGISLAIGQELDLPQVGGTYVTPVYSSGNANTRSFVRLYNSSDTDGEAIVYLFDSVTGTELGEWRQNIPAHASLQYEIDELETGGEPMVESDDPYALYVLSTFDGFVQNVVWNAVGGSLTNISTCGRDIAEDERFLGNVHTSLLSTYPSTIVLKNTGSETQRANIDVYDAAEGALIGSWSTADLDPGTLSFIEASSVEFDLGFEPDRGQFHLNLEIDDAFEGYGVHVVDNLTSGVLTNMTDKCRLNAVALEE